MKAVFLYRGESGCERLWKEIEHQHITLVEQSADHAPAELILNARAFRRPRDEHWTEGNMANMAGMADMPNMADMSSVPSAGVGAFVREEAEVGGLLVKLSLPSSACSREVAQVLQSLSEHA